MKKLSVSPLFELIVVGGILVVQILVVIIGFSAYQKLNTIISYVKVPEIESEEILLMREIVSDVSRAEHFAKTYRLTGNRDYLPDYYKTTVALGHKIDKLEQVQWENKKQEHYAEEIFGLTEQALRNYNEMITLQSSESVTDALVNISAQLEPVKGIETEVPNIGDNLPGAKESFFKRVFGSDEDTGSGQKKIQNDSLELLRHDIRKQLRVVEATQKEEIRKLNTLELQLTEKSLNISEGIFSLVGKIEEIEKERIRDRNDKAELLADESRNALLRFGTVISLLLLVTIFFTFRYILSNRKMKNVLSSEKEHAQMIADARQNLLSHMSHEIRTPLNSVIGFLEQVLESDLNDQQREHILIAKKSSDHLLGIINNILESSKLKSGKIKFSEINFSPIQLLTEVVSSMRIQAHAKNLEMEYENTGEMPDLVSGDPLRLKQVVLNIIGNAIKYTHKGSVKLSARSDNQKLILEIADTGEGIPEDKLGTIFEKYEQLHNDSLQPGTGLGLYITRGLVESQGGSIEIKSTEGKGTVVTLIIPYKKATVPASEAVLEGIRYTGHSFLRGKHILIADDEKYNRMLLAAILKKNGILFTEATNGLEALEAVKNTSFDLVLMDVRMPGLDGVNATREIRAIEDKSKSAVPIIALTAGLATEKLERCREAGMDEFMEKPFREGVLLQKIFSLISKNVSLN
ncbi:MAG: response regulator [Crocinitomicaceae bacterium]|nr:response regulator [Crocinitomicaceae bacterium]